MDGTNIGPYLPFPHPHSGGAKVPCNGGEQIVKKTIVDEFHEEYFGKCFLEIDDFEANNNHILSDGWNKYPHHLSWVWQKFPAREVTKSEKT